MKKKPVEKPDKERLNFHISPTLYDQLEEFARDNGFKRVSEAAWFLLHAAMMKRADERRVSPPPAKSFSDLMSR
jgi:hypothetical protein